MHPSDCPAQPLRHDWSLAAQAIAAVEQRRADLPRLARQRCAAGVPPQDQDFPPEIYTLRPARPRLRPLVLVGGMGPLAGLDGFIGACRLFGERREVVLYQACGIPSRSVALASGAPALERALVDALAAAVAVAVGYAGGQSALDVVVLCNTAHVVLPALLSALEQGFPEVAVRVRLWSLVDGVRDALSRPGPTRPLLLSTRATRDARLYAAPLAAAGLAPLEPDEPLQELLEQAVYAGVKTGDRPRALELARRLFALAGQQHPDADALLAGCTEIPILLRWLDEAGDAPLPLLRRPLLDPVRLTLEANRDALIGAAEATLPERLFAAVARHGPRAALCTPGRTWSYAELGAEVRRIADGLLARLGPANEPVAVLCDARGETIPALLGALAAGKIYVPVDVGAPAPRARLILEDAQVRAVLAAPEQAEAAARFAPAACPVILLDTLAADGEPEPPALTPDSLAYLLYTSGSTGRPKGVAQDHRYVLTLVDNYTRSGAIGPSDRLALLSSLAFSASVRDVFCALLGGATLYTWDVPGQGVEGLGRWMGEQGITLFFAVASLYRAFARTLEPAQVPALRLVQIGSESVYGSDLALFRAHFPRTCRLMVNLGSTELSPVRQRLLDHDGPIPDGSIPLDLAVPGNELLLLDRAGQPVAAGAVGAIVVRGRALSPGYWGRSDLTLASLRPDALGYRRYDTGDLGRLLPDGSLQHLGRADQQLKVRGYRVDPNEVEAALRALAGVRDAAVTVDPHGSGALYGYLVPADPRDPPAEQAIRRALLARLPEPMVPARLMVLEALPVGPTGKIDRRALPPPAAAAQRAPETATERRMAALWQEVLGHPVDADTSLLLLGGSSLAAARIAARLGAVFGAHLPLAALFESPTVAALAARIDAGEGRLEAAGPALAARAEPGRAPLSPGQRGFWLQDQLEGASATPVIARAWRLRGALAVDALRQAIQALARRHEVLRSVYTQVDGEPFALPAAGDIPLVEEALPAAALAERLRRAWDEPFDLGAAPPIRFLLLHLDPEEHVLLACLHHIAGDDASTLVLARDLSALYAAALAGRAPRLPELAVQVGDHAAWLAARAAAVAARWSPWWRDELRDAPPSLDLPFDHPRRRGYRPGAVPVRLDADATAALLALARARGATAFATLLAAFAALLGRVCDSDDVVIGAPLSRRSPPQTEELIGCFVHTLPLRLRPDPAQGFDALLEQAGRALPRALEAGELPFDAIVGAVAPDRPAGLNPVVQVMLTLVENFQAPLALPGLASESLALAKATAGANVDLTLSIEQVDGALAGRLEYNALLFAPATIAVMAAQLETLLRAVAAEPARPLGRLCLSPASVIVSSATEADVQGRSPAPWAMRPLPSREPIGGRDPQSPRGPGSYPMADETRPKALSPQAEREAMRRWDTGTAGAYPRRPVQRLFAEWVARTPDAPALVACGADGAPVETLTYADLDAAAARLAGRLARAGAGPGERVAIVLERSVAEVVATLATLKTGAAYVPVDPAYPAERIAWMLEDVRPAAVVSCAADARHLPAAVAWLDVHATAAADAAAAPVPEITAEAPAYLMYTSGSTGRPKGVVVPHRAIAHLVIGTDYARFGPDQTVLHIANPAFDAATFEIWGALLNGARLVVGPPGVTALATLERIIREQGVRLAFFTAGLMNALVDERPEVLAAIPQLLSGGEAMSLPHAARLLERFPNLGLVNAYGPTECTTYSVTHRVRPADLGGTAIPIGRPIANARLRVLDRRGEPAPVGVPGELYIGGAGLSLGYWERPGLNRERFVELDGERFYRSGDRVRRRADGVLVYSGRFDDQVKLRGFRVEPGEVERALRTLPGVRQAAVAVRELAGGRTLLAWVVPEGPQVGAADLLAALAGRLPAYLLPTAIGLLDSLPLNANGKVDLRALPDPGVAPGSDAEAPATPEEAAVAAAFAALLGHPVGRHDSFFALGGHSLLALRLVSRLAESVGVQLPPGAVWETPTVAGLAQRLRAGEAFAPLPEIVPEPGSAEAAPLSAAQTRLWFLHRLDPAAATYNMAYALRAEGALDAAALEAALRDLLARHSVLRMGVAERAGEPVATFHAPVAFTLARESLPDTPEHLRRRVTAEAERPFDLARDLLLRATLITLGPASHALLLTMHHIVSDGWSMGVFTDELRQLYAARCAGRPDPLPPLPVQYADYAIGQQRWLAGAGKARQMAWWRDYLAGAPPFIALPGDRPRPGEQTSAGARLDRPLPAALAAALERTARRAEATAYMVGLSAFALLLSRWAGQDDLVLGLPVANRRTRRAEELIGFFVNTLALRLRLDGDPSVEQLLARVRQALLDAWQRQDLPFDLVVEAAQPERSLGYPPLFNVMFDLEEAAAPFQLDGVALSHLPRDHQIARFDLTLNLVRGADAGWVAAWEYNRDLFDAATIERMAGHWEALLHGLADQPQAPARRLPMLAAAERAALLRPAAPVPPGPSMLHQLVSASARRTPDAPAVVGERESLSYAQLTARAGALAGALRAQGVGPGERVLVLMGRSPALIAALLGVMQAGAAWVPVDPTQPAERVARIVQDARPLLALSEQPLADLLPPELPRLCLDSSWPDHAPWQDPGDDDPQRLCYVIYTSGSTGEPRGVLIPHRAAAAFARSAREVYGIGAADRVLQFASIAFDAAVEEIFPCLSAGGCLVLRTDEMLRSPQRFLERCREQALTVVDLPTSFWHDLVLEMERFGLDLPPTLRLVIIGGEAALPPRLALWRRLLRGRPAPRLLNTYGPTEATVVATCCDLGAWRPDDPEPHAVPIGRPLPGVRALVLDADGEPVPVGVAGELHLGGVGLAHGYLGRPEATAAAFIADPRAPDERLYRTGDRVRWRGDGELEFVGRLDHQIKIRGFRVEPGEIEAALRRHPSVADAVVGVHEADGRRRLVAHVVGSGGVDVPALKAWLRRDLPEYMVPEAVVVLASFPINRQGKVDRRALPPPEPEARGGLAAQLGSPAEQALAAIWRAELGEVTIGPDDNFFDLGGTSLALIRVHARIGEQMGVELALVELFRHPTLRSLAGRIGGEARPAAPVVASAQRQDGRARLARQRGGRGGG